MSKILVLGCGDLAWGKPSSSALAGRQWSRGRISEEIQPAKDGLRFESPAVEAVRLADEIEELSAWSPTRALFGPLPKIAIEPGNRTEGPLLPPWAEFVTAQARWATKILAGPGVLVTPGDWLASPKGRFLLEAWVGEGWSWAPLEAAVRGKYLPQDRIASSSGLWLRLTEEGGGLVCANGPEAARAVDVMPLALKAAVQALGDQGAEEWWRDEEPQTGWYARQRIRRGIIAALKQGRTRVELGVRASLFGFSSEEAFQRFRELAGVRIVIPLEPPAVSWWEWIADPGFLESPDGVLHTSGIRWGERKTVLFEGEGIRQLANHLAYKGLPREEIDPAGLEEALNIGGALPPLPRSAESLEEPIAISLDEMPDEVEAPAPPLAALMDYQPDRFELRAPHAPEHLRVLIDGERVDQENVRRSPRDSTYTITGRAVAHGSIVRVDYKPAQDNS